MLTRTTTQILDSLRDPANADMWQLFDERYRPVIHAFALQRGLTDSDAAEVAQTTLAQFTADYGAGRYDRSRGRLSSWILGIASHRIADLGRNLQRRRRDRGESAFEELASASSAEECWQAAMRKIILERALRALREETRLDERTVKAFELCSLRGVPAPAVAAECLMTLDEVYVAKNRAIKKLREIVQRYEHEFEED
ncbi:MAG: sigma-70 family RNA polymerase sigma factor [Phycisphaeraceae bacterium]|nr:MAG: sigma-70 family RNA polymerase sigma factor [Phycisphaeraceae bacterium]